MADALVPVDAAYLVCTRPGYPDSAEVSDRPEPGAASRERPWSRTAMPRSGADVARGATASHAGPRHVPIPDTGDPGDGGEVERDAEPVVLGERHDVGDEVPSLAKVPEEEQPSELAAGIGEPGAPAPVAPSRAAGSSSRGSRTAR